MAKPSPLMRNMVPFPVVACMKSKSGEGGFSVWSNKASVLKSLPYVLTTIPGREFETFEDDCIFSLQLIPPYPSKQPHSPV